MSPVPHIVLTECLPASPTGSEDLSKDLTNNSVEDSPSQDWTGQSMVYQTQISKERDSFGRSSQPEREYHCFKHDTELKQELAILLTDLEVRVMPSLEAQKLSKTAGDALQTLTILQDTKEISEVQLSVRPLLVLFEKNKTAKEAYRLLHSLVESSRPVPKPRRKSSLHTGQQSSLLEALSRGIETGDGILTLQHNTEAKQNSVKSTLERTGSTSSVVSPAGQTRMTEDIRRSTYRRLDSLEETIRELENTLIEISGHPTAEQLYTKTTIKSTSAQMTGSPTSEAKKPLVPPKPSSLSPASIQVYCLTPAVQIPALKQHALFSYFTFFFWVIAGTSLSSF